MNVTLAIDDDLLERARRLAAHRGISLNQMIRDLLAERTAASAPAAILADLERLWTEAAGDSQGVRWTREDLYDRPVLR